MSHSDNEQAAEELCRLIRECWSGADIVVYPARGLCSFYAEKGGLLIGFEK